MNMEITATMDAVRIEQWVVGGGVIGHEREKAFRPKTLRNTLKKPFPTKREKPGEHKRWWSRPRGR